MASSQFVPASTTAEAPTINSPNSLTNSPPTQYQKTKIGGQSPSSTTTTTQPTITPKNFPPPIATKSLKRTQWLAPLPPDLTPVGPQTGTGGTTAQQPADESMEGATRTSPNPALEVMRSGYPMSRPEDAPRQGQKNEANPATGQANAPLGNSSVAEEKDEGRQGGLAGLSGLPSIATAASAMQIDSDESPATSIASGGGISGGESGPTITAGPAAHVLNTPLSAHPMSGELSAITPTTPGFSMSATTPTTPYSPSLLTPISAGGPGRAKHTCNHCSQTFTRHHNLKSHLLTHSHEKPYVCNTCQARFRRLHDLKRHTKLHTGERPHMCEKCGRRFARGDALARHARGEGGCAGRRSSMTGMPEGDSMVEMSGMEGDEDGGLGGMLVEEDNDITMLDSTDATTPISPSGSGTPGNITSMSAARRHASLPSIKTNVDNGTSHSHTHLHQYPAHLQPHPHGHGLQSHSTYPPVTPARSTAGTSPGGGGLFPPTPNHAGRQSPSSSTSPSIPNSALSATSPRTANTGNPTILQQGNMTDSPRPLSPSNQSTEAGKTKYNQYRAQQQQQASILPSPMTPQSATQNVASLPQQGHPLAPKFANTHQQHGSGMNNSSKPNQQAAQANMGFQHQQSSSSQQQQQQEKGGNASGNSNGTGGAGASGENPNMFENERGLWDYVKDMERRLVEVEAELRAIKQQNQQQLQKQQQVMSTDIATTGSATVGTVGGGGGGSGNGNGGGNTGGDGS